MSAMTDDELIARLGQLGDDIDRAGVDDGAGDDRGLVDAVLEAVESTPHRRRSRSWIAAAVLLVVALLGVLAVPDSRRAVARWFGLDGVVVEVDSNLSLPSTDGRDEQLGPGERRVVVVGGREILVTAVRGAFDERLITKTVGSSEQLRAVSVNGLPGLWIADAPHEVLFGDPDTEVVVERVAANTLLWNDGDVLYRIEGFDVLDAALEFAREKVAPPADG